MTTKANEIEVMKTQISNLINGSEFTIRDLANAKYNGVKFVCNKPQIGGTPREIREAISAKVGQENAGALTISVKGIEFTLNRHDSASGKTWFWETEISSEDFHHIAGFLPVWTHKGADNRYSISVNKDCTVYLRANSGKKESFTPLDEAFVEIL